MPRYLVLANQTAASPELTNVIREIVANDSDTEFVLLIPATPVEDLLDWQEGDGETIAKRTAQAAKDHLVGVGAKVARTEVGDPAPVKAIENELKRHQENTTASSSPLCRCKDPAGLPSISRAESSGALKSRCDTWWGIPSR